MKRTDLAIEAHNFSSEEADTSGVLINEEEKNGIRVTSVEVTNEMGSKRIGKPLGKYVTIEAPDIKYSTEVYENACHVISDEIKKLCKLNNESMVLVVGLGNRDITPDALGTEAVSKIMVTNHLKTNAPHIFDGTLRSVCAIAPGVLGTTGIESVEITKAVAKKIDPDLIIVIDALAAADYSRICTTFQLSDAGIAPGSGVGNNREAFSKEVLGTDVIAIGVPTVIDIQSVCEDISESMFVTPKDIDLVTERCAKTIAGAINLAVLENFSLKEIEEYVG